MNLKSIIIRNEGESKRPLPGINHTADSKTCETLEGATFLHSFMWDWARPNHLPNWSAALVAEMKTAWSKSRALWFMPILTFNACQRYDPWMHKASRKSFETLWTTFIVRSVRAQADTMRTRSSKFFEANPNGRQLISKNIRKSIDAKKHFWDPENRHCLLPRKRRRIGLHNDPLTSQKKFIQSKFLTAKVVFQPTENNHPIGQYTPCPLPHRIFSAEAERSKQQQLGNRDSPNVFEHKC